MPWVGLGYCTFQENYAVTAPGGRKIYRVLMTCGACQHREESGPIMLEEDLTAAMLRITNHWTEHLPK